MKIVLGMNYKFFDVSPTELFQIIEAKDYMKSIKGAEISLGLSKYLESDMDYLIEVAKICKEKDFIFNLHSPCLDSVENSKAYLDYSNELQKIYGKRINIVVHSINKKYHENSIRLTDEYIGNLLDYIRECNYDLSISIENLNILDGQKRLIKDDLMEILDKYPDLNFTYDIGHEIVDNIKFVRLPEIINKKMNNIHFHSFKEGRDHHPPGMYEDIETLQEFIRTLHAIDYQGTIVLEYDLNYLDGDNVKERIATYIEKACELYRLIEINRNKKV